MIPVLFVEDDDDLRTLMSEELELEGFEIHAAKNALTFYQLLATSSAQIAVIDVGLPDQSGLEIASYLRANSNLGIVLLTALDGPNDKLNGYRSGADAYCVKPISGEELSLILKNLLSRINIESKAKNTWFFDKTHWQLVSPAGEALKLSGKEMIFLNTLSGDSGSQSSRAHLLSKLNYPSNYYGEHALESLVLRLRKKIAELTPHDHPIKTIRGYGYHFTGAILDPDIKV